MLVLNAKFVVQHIFVQPSIIIILTRRSQAIVLASPTSLYIIGIGIPLRRTYIYSKRCFERESLKGFKLSTHITNKLIPLTIIFTRKSSKRIFERP